MDISIVKDNSLRIKTNKAAVVTDPVSKVEAQIVILTDGGDYDLDKVEEKRLVITGPGEYEVGGISVTARNIKEDLVFDIEASDYSSYKILLIPSSAVSKIQEEDEYDCVLIKVNSEISDDALSSFVSKIYVFYGDLSALKLKNENIVKTNRVSLKKSSEFLNKIVLLSQ